MSSDSYIVPGDRLAGGFQPAQIAVGNFAREMMCSKPTDERWNRSWLGVILVIGDYALRTCQGARRKIAQHCGPKMDF